MILVKNLNFSYNRNKNILQNICFSSDKGRCVAILGNNGAGKSTLVKCFNRILKPTGGSVFVSGKAIEKLPRNDIAKIISYVAQHNSGEQFTVYDSVLLGRKPYLKFEPSSEDIAIVESVIEKMGLKDNALRYVDELSGGERQKVMLARALAQQPKILLLDEPTSNLDLHNQYMVLETVKKIALNDEMLVIIVIHDLNLALRYCDKFLLVKGGSIYAYGGQEIMTPENICHVYDVPVAVESVCGVPVVVPLPMW